MAFPGHFVVMKVKTKSDQVTYILLWVLLKCLHDWTMGKESKRNEGESSSECPIDHYSDSRVFDEFNQIVLSFGTE